MTHTPGPWGLSQEAYVDYVTAGPGTLVAGVYQAYCGAKDQSEQHANAQLIKTSPEMIDVLFLAAEVLDSYGMPDNHRVTLVKQRIADVIAKAKGETE